jgi:LysR family transcriptional regulator, benzoate and cis,cis-muconate-responsive activator of ben and cat genes
MDIRELKAFSVVAQELNFRKASEILGMTQPPLTRLISNLEESLGVKLFHRTTRSVELTGEGVFLLNRARQILGEMDILESDIRAIGKAKSKTIKLSLQPCAIHTSIPRLISSFKEQFPNIKFQIVETTFKNPEDDLRKGKVDISMGNEQKTTEEFQQFPLEAYALGMLINKRNPLSKKKSIQFQDLTGETLIFHGKQEHLGFQEDFHNLMKSKKIPVKVYYKKLGESCGNLVIVDKGLLITSKKFVPKSSEVIFVPFSDFVPKQKITAMWSNKSQSPEVKSMISFMEEHSSVPHSDMDYHL